VAAHFNQLGICGIAVQERVKQSTFQRCGLFPNYFRISYYYLGGHVAHQLTQSVLLDTETEGSGADQTTKQQESRKCGYKGRAKQASKPPSVKLQPPTYGRKRYDQIWMYI